MDPPRFHSPHTLVRLIRYNDKLFNHIIINHHDLVATAKLLNLNWRIKDVPLSYFVYFMRRNNMLPISYSKFSLFVMRSFRHFDMAHARVEMERQAKSAMGSRRVIQV